ncbi:MAG: hypothetical protein NVS4B11_09510 [Ktedonobacteraceae bacterium]
MTGASPVWITHIVALYDHEDRTRSVANVWAYGYDVLACYLRYFSPQVVQLAYVVTASLH